MCCDSDSGRRMPKEQVGRISFLLAKFAIQQLNTDSLAQAIGISCEELALYENTINKTVDAKTLFHRTPCPLCVIGEVLYMDKECIDPEINRWRVHLQCSNCQEKFIREDT